MTSTDLLFQAVLYFVNMAVVAVIVAIIVLLLVRLALNYADLNPFSRPVLTVRNLTDPFLTPVRRALLGFGFSPNMAPLVAILIAILVGWLALELSTAIIETLAGVTNSVRAGRPIRLVGHLLYGALSVYSLLIFIRIIFSWGQVSYGNRVMRFLVRATEPLLGPLRRIIPPLGFMDISPIVAFLLIWLFQSAIAGTLLRF
ncbi:MAG TPA: YggT family protein [Pyrinomonadaceae bacterium]|nr:YggT family protein [Pyrinomonadaceae bacterium]